MGEVLLSIALGIVTLALIAESTLRRRRPAPAPVDHTLNLQEPPDGRDLGYGIERGPDGKLRQRPARQPEPEVIPADD